MAVQHGVSAEIIQRGNLDFVIVGQGCAAPRLGDRPDYRRFELGDDDTPHLLLRRV